MDVRIAKQDNITQKPARQKGKFTQNKCLQKSLNMGKINLKVELA